MLSNDYKKFLQPLRDREVQPSFEEIRSLVSLEKSSRKVLPIPFWLYLSASAPLLLALSVLLYPEIYGLERSNHQSVIVDRQSPIETSGKQQLTIVEKDLSSSTPRPSSFVNHKLLSSIQGNPKINNNERTTLDDRKMTNENREVKTDAKPSLPIANPPLPVVTTNELLKTNDDSRLAIEDNTDHRLSLFISGGLPPVSSSVAFADRLYGAIGIQYHMSPASSVIIELRRNAFIQKYDAQKISFRDTILTAGNQSYHSTIGELTSFRAQSPNDVVSLGAGYRFTFISSGRFLPFAEALFGVASQGWLTSQMAGIQYSFSSPFSFEFGVRADQLFAKGSAAQTAFNLNAALNFSW